jgi:hypothetical protein
VLKVVDPGKLSQWEELCKSLQWDSKHLLVSQDPDEE